MWFRALFGQAPTTDAEVADAVAALLSGIAVDYPRLVAHSRELTEEHQTHA